MKKIVLPALALTLICLVCAAALAYTNGLTAPIIEKLAQDQQKQAMQRLLPAAADFGEEKTVKLEDGTELNYYRATDSDGKSAGYIVLSAAEGYGGEIAVMSAISAEKTVLGVELLSLSETPGLGMKAQDETWLGQFAGKVLGVGVSKGSADGNQIQAITGATITSTAVTRAVDQALKAAELI
jgi:electron transport complex protein RnfG